MPKKRTVSVAKKRKISQRKRKMSQRKLESEQKTRLTPKETHRERMQIGEEDADVYSETGRDLMEESDEIAPWEEGFSEGAEEKSGLSVCFACGKPLGDRGDVTEREFKGEIRWYCSEKCAQRRR